MKRARDDALHVYSAVSGEELAAVSVEEFPTVRSLKQHLQGCCGVPRFRQRLLADDTNLQDDAMLGQLGSSNLRLVLLPFASGQHAGKLTGAVNRGAVQQVEALLQRPQNPDLRDRFGQTPLYAAALRGRREIVELLLEARARGSTRASSRAP